MLSVLKKLLPLLLSSGLALATHAATLRIASAFDPQTMDPHALALLYHTRVSVQIYEGLVNRDEQFRLEPSLALSWQATGPTTWRFKLRPGVLFAITVLYALSGPALTVWGIWRARARHKPRGAAEPPP